MKLRLILYIVMAFLAGCQTLEDQSITARQFPIYPNGGKPDLTVDTRRLVTHMGIMERYFPAGDCALEEKVVGAKGFRRILYFDTVIINAGDGDLVVGSRSDPENMYANLFQYAPCHRHYHISDFTSYELLRAEDRSVVATSPKQGFCFEDTLHYAGGRSNGYGCSNQGITSGWGDLYRGQVTGQWIDITGIPAGDYILQVGINISGSFDEGEDRYPNLVQVPVHIPPAGAASTGPLAGSW